MSANASSAPRSSASASATAPAFWRAPGGGRLAHRRHQPRRGDAARARRRGCDMQVFARGQPLADAAARSPARRISCISVPPDAAGDPGARPLHGADIAALPQLALGRLSLDDRRLWRSRRRAGSTRRRRAAPSGERGRRRVAAEAAWLALQRRTGCRCISSASPASTARAAARSIRCAQGTRAAHRQAGPGLLAHPCRRHRGGAARLDGAARTRAPSTMSATTIRRRPRR